MAEIAEHDEGGTATSATVRSRSGGVGPGGAGLGEAGPGEAGPGEAGPGEAGPGEARTRAVSAQDAGSSDEVIQWVKRVAQVAASKTDQEIVVLNVGEVLGITDYFVICSGRNSRQVKTLAEEIERGLSDSGGPKPRQLEGLDSLQWILMDYGDFVVHVFLDETRDYYDLERLWADVPHIDWLASTD